MQSKRLLDFFPRSLKFIVQCAGKSVPKEAKYIAESGEFMLSTEAPMSTMLSQIFPGYICVSFSLC